METEEKEKKENNSEKKENELNNKALDKKQILQDKLKKIFFEREQNKYKYNKINIPENLKYSSDNSNNSNSSHEANNNKDENKDKNVEDNKNSSKENNIIDNENINNNSEEKKSNIKQPSKNYVIIKPPERKKTKEKDEELKNKIIVFGSKNNKKNTISNKEENNDNIKNIIIKEEETKENKIINDNNKNIKIENEKQENKINNDNINLNSKEKEEEKNKQLYQQLMAKKCQNIIKLENEKKDNDLIMNNIKVIKDETNDNNKILKDILIPESKKEINDKKRSKTINANRINEESNTKEGTLKILQLIKAKKNEKNLIEEKMKETKNNIKEEQNQNKNEENNIVDDKQKIYITPDKKESTNDNDTIKLSENKTEKTENIIDINTSKEESQIKSNDNINNNEIIKNNTIDTITKKQIYKKFKGKGKSCLIGNNNNNNNNNNFLTIKNKSEKELTENLNQQIKKEPKTILRNKMNRHLTSLNVTKKKYIIKPKELELHHWKNNKDNISNDKILIEENCNINNNNYSEMTKTFKNKKSHINNLYEPKKGILYNNKKQYDERSLNLNIENKSPIRLNVEKKIAYFKKSPITNSSNKTLHKLNNSIENISPFIYQNLGIEKIVRNNLNTQIDYNKYSENRNNLNSSFKLANELGKTYYNIGNIFNLDSFEDDNNINLNNNFNINFNVDSLYKINYPIKKNKIKQNNGYKTFYSNNYSKENNNIFDKKGNNNQNTNNKYNNNMKRINNSIYYQYKNNINSNPKKINANKINKSLKEKYNYSLYNSLKYEDLLILENKLDNILTSLIEEKIIYNACFEFWNYFFNNSLYENLNIIYSNYDNEYNYMFKMSINYILLSIMLLYDISFDKNTLIKINPLLREMLELSHILLIIIYKYILNIIPFTKNNIWINKISNLIQKMMELDESDSFLIETERRPEKEKLNLNLNFLSKKIYYILNNYSSKNSKKILSNFFKSKNNTNKSLEELNEFFLENILRQKDIKYSILAFHFLKNGGEVSNFDAPFLNFRKSKKYFLVFDIDETLFHFKISEEDPEQGILQIRPGAFQLIEEVRKYYEIILFSEAEKDYIDLIISSINNKRFYYDYILCRDYISIEGNNFIKDLNKIGTPLDKTIIIDNMPQNFRNHKENAIYIKSFFGDEKDDKALVDLIYILVNIAKSGKDVRNELIKYKEEIVNKISSNLYKNNDS